MTTFILHTNPSLQDSTYRKQKEISPDDFIESVPVETPITFEKFSLEDKEMKKVFVDTSTNVEMMKYNNNSTILTKKQAEEKYEGLAKQNSVYTYYTIVFENKHVGYISLYKTDETTGSFAMFVKKQFQGKGIGTIAVAAIINFYKNFKKKLGINKAESVVNVRNNPSNRVMVKVGMKIVEKEASLRGMIANKYEILL